MMHSHDASLDCDSNPYLGKIRIFSRDVCFPLYKVYLHMTQCCDEEHKVEFNESPCTDTDTDT